MKQKHSPKAAGRVKRSGGWKAWLCAVLIVLMMLAAGAAAYWFLIREKEEKPYLPRESRALMAAADGMDLIRVEAALDPDSRTLTVVQELQVVNRTGQAQDAVVLRSWSGAYLAEETSPAASAELYSACYPQGFNPGGLTLVKAYLNGGATIWRWLDEASTVLAIPADWQEGQSATVTLHYTVQIPLCASRFGYADSTFMLGNVFPTPAVWQRGAWRTDAYCAIGDPFLSECANWEVALTVPEGWQAAASVWAEPEKDGGAWTYRFTGRAMRDFALVVSNRLVSVQGMRDGVLVTAYARTEKAARELLKYARQALHTCGSRWGEYAWPTYTVTGAAMPLGGMAYPGLAMISADVIAEGGTLLEYTLAHETAHQWWGAMVSSDGWYQPWQDEALCEYAFADYADDWYGPDERERVAFERFETALRITIPRGVTPGSPIDYFGDLTEYSQVVRQRGAAMWMALETHLGKAQLDAALREYQAQYRFRNASREDLTEVLSQHAGHDVSGLMLDYLDTYMN